ncbi:MAG: alkaline phosphatase [Verrucomicrobiales bacterium]|nr:alkaline phosphatase [Verrucomicrobiales bacterium]
MARGRIRTFVEERIEGEGSHYTALFLASFLEATVVPIPLETILIPYFLTHRERLWKTSFVVLLGCLAGAMLGYGVGAGLLDSFGNTLREWMAGSNSRNFEEEFHRNGFVAIFTAGVSPIPFQLAMLTAGATNYPVALFLLAASMARGIRYFGLAFLVWKFGEKASDIWQKNKLLAGLLVLSIVGALYGISKLVALWFNA